MSTEEDRRWDMERDRAWVCKDCGKDDDGCECDEEQIGMLNSPMFRTEAAPGEYVDWSKPDVLPTGAWEPLLDVSVEDYAAANPHMIVFVAEGR